MQDRFKYKVKFEIDGKVEIFDVANLDIERGQIFFKREDGQYYNIGIGCEDVELLQCTGLKDKNGKLIYEGDIVKTITQPNIIENVGIVKWDNKSAQFLRTSNLESEDLVSFWWNDTVEVIGNIYENPELLSEVE